MFGGLHLQRIRHDLAAEVPADSGPSCCHDFAQREALLPAHDRLALDDSSSLCTAVFCGGHHARRLLSWMGSDNRVRSGEYVSDALKTPCAELLFIRLVFRHF